MEDTSRLLELTADIVAAHVSNNTVAVGDVANLVAKVHDSLATLGQAAPDAGPAKPEPRVSIRSSIKPDYIVCLLDGSKHKMLKRHLQNSHGLTPREYREQFALRDDYPMVAPNYSESRRDLAKKIGLGTKRRKGATASNAGASKGRRGKAAAPAE